MMKDIDSLAGFSGLLVLYLVSTTCLEWSLYPGWGQRLQLSEVLFILVMIAGLLKLKTSGAPFSWTMVDTAVLIYLAINLLSATVNFSQSSLLEVLVRSYLVGVYLAFRVAVGAAWFTWAHLRFAVMLMAVVLILITALGYGFLAFGQETILLAKYPDYPYLGTVFRAKGLMQTPSMYISIVNYSFLFIWCDALFNGFTRTRSLLLAGLFICAFFSFSKAVLLLGLVIIWSSLRYYRPQYRALAWSVCGLVAIVYFGLTNFVYISDPAHAELEAGHLAVPDVHAFSEPTWFATAYISAKKAAIHLATTAPLVGIGPGGFYDRIDEMKAENWYPRHLPPHDPHSIYFGALAETGLLGLLSLLILIGTCFWVLTGVPDVPLRLFLLIWLIVLAIEGLNGDLMNFRHYWVQIGLIGGMAQLIQKKSGGLAAG